MTVDTVTDVRTFDGLCDEWTELLSDSDAGNVFLSWEWLHTWWQHLGRARRLSILTVRENGRLVGLAPMTRARATPHRLLLPDSLEFLGSGQVGSDYLDLIIRRGYEVAVVEALAADLNARRTTLHLTRLDATAATWRLGEVLSGSGWTSRHAVTSACPFIDLRGASWASYLESRSSSMRYAFRRKLRGLEQHGQVALEIATTEQARHEALERLIVFHLERWAPRGGSDGFSRAALRTFHDDFSRLALTRGWLRLFTLRVGPVPVASLYCLRSRDSMMFYQSGFDLRWAARSVGVVAMGLTIKAAIDEGAATYDLLHGEEPYKAHWADRTRTQARLELYPATLGGALGRHTVEAVRGSRRALRRLVSLTSTAHVPGRP